MLLIGAQVEIWVADLQGSKAVLVLFGLLWTAPLFFRRRFPLVAPVVPFAAVATETFFAAQGVNGAIMSISAAIFAAWSLGVGNERRRALAGAAVCWACGAIINRNFGASGVGDFVFITLLVAAPVTAGQLLRAREVRAHELRERTARLQAGRDERARAAVADERARIARELHDVVAHSISVMTIQAGAARLLLEEDPARAEEPLLSIEDTGRETLAEMRRLLGVLRSDMTESALEPRPTLEHVESLIEHVRDAGLPVELSVEGDRRPLAPGVDLAAYRIVQEALTNVRKHAGPARAWVAVRYGQDALDLEILNDGARGTNGGPGSGHGIVGMRERVAVYGGELEAGPREEGGFRIHVRLPLERLRS